MFHQVPSLYVAELISQTCDHSAAFALPVGTPVLAAVIDNVTSMTPDLLICAADSFGSLVSLEKPAS
jgi:hypothetical protein